MKAHELRQAVIADESALPRDGGAPSALSAPPLPGPVGSSWIVAVLDDLVLLSGNIGLAETAQALKNARLRAEAELSRDASFAQMA